MVTMHGSSSDDDSMSGNEESLNDQSDKDSDSGEIVTKFTARVLLWSFPSPHNKNVGHSARLDVA